MQLLELEPGDMLKATACATLIEALRSEGRYKEGNRIGERLLEEDSSSFARTIAYYEMAYNLAEMEEDLDQALDYAQRSLELAPEELRQFPLAALGWVHFKRQEFEQAIEFLERSSRLGSSATAPPFWRYQVLDSTSTLRLHACIYYCRRAGYKAFNLVFCCDLFLGDK